MNVKYGIIGLGGIAQVFAGALNAVSDTELLAVASGSRERAEAFRKNSMHQKYMTVTLN